MAYLEPEERDAVKAFLQGRVLRRFSIEEIKGMAKNGGVYLACGDGDVDIRQFHETISERPHGVQFFGAPLYLARSFRDYSSFIAEWVIQNIKYGMEAKKTDTLFCYFHYPCGMATKFGHNIKDVFRMAFEAIDVLQDDRDFDRQRLHFFFHVKRINKGGIEEQNTYKYFD